MPAVEGTLTVQDVALHLWGSPLPDPLPDEERLTAATDAARQWVTDRRWTIPDPLVLFALDDVHLGAVLYAAALYQARVTPEGMAGYAPSVGGVDTYNLVYRAKDLIGADVGFA